MMEKIIAVLAYTVVTIIIVVLSYSTIYFFSTTVESIKVHEPEKGIHCAVVSRMFNTSISCWSINHEQD